MMQAFAATMISGISAVAVAYLSDTLNRQVNLGIAQKRLQKYARNFARRPLLFHDGPVL